MAAKKGKVQQKLAQEMKSEIEMYEAEKERQKVNQANILTQFQFKPFNPSEPQKKMLNKIKENEITFVSGPAGTGKTIIALKAALEMVQQGKYNKIIITKPIIEAVEELGFLPGDIASKVDPYLNSFEANLTKLIGAGLADKFFKSDIIKFVPLSYMRGNTIDTIAILDEAQNTTISGLKLFLTRKGENSKMIIMGDVTQTDLNLKRGEQTALEDAVNRFRDIKGVSFMEFQIEDIMRSGILIEILKRYER